MSKPVSLKNSSEFKHVYDHGRSRADRLLVMYVAKNNLPYNRYGISAGKKIGNSVVRHRITRLIRESFRLSDHMFNSGLDIVVIARSSVIGKKYVDVNTSMMHLAGYHHILRSE